MTRRVELRIGGSSEHGDSTSHRVDSASRVSQEVDFDFDFDQGLTS